MDMSVYESSGDSSGYAHVARPRLADVQHAARVPPWFHTPQPGGANIAHLSPASSSGMMPYAGGLVPPARVQHVTRAPPPPSEPPPPPPVSADFQRRRQLLLHQPPAAGVWCNSSLTASHDNTAGAAVLRSPAATGECARIHRVCCRVLSVVFASSGVCGVVLVLVDVLLRHRWPSVHGLLFIGVLLLFVSIVMLFVLIRRSPSSGVALSGKLTHGTAQTCVERIPLTAVVSGDNVYVEAGRHSTLPRRFSPSSLPPRCALPAALAPSSIGAGRSEYSHPWDHLVDCNRQYADCGVSTVAPSVSGSHGYANTVSLPR